MVLNGFEVLGLPLDDHGAQCHAWAWAGSHHAAPALGALLGVSQTGPQASSHKHRIYTVHIISIYIYNQII